MANMLFANNCNTTLNGGITAVANSMVVTSATGFPVPTGSQYFYCTLADAATQTTIEIVKVTAVSGTTFTIVRGQDGTSGTIFASGAVVSLRLVRANLNDFPKLDEANTFTQAQTFSALTSGRIPFSSTGGLQTDSANLTFDGSNLNVSGIVSASTLSSSGALYSNNGTVAARVIASGAASYWGNTSNHPVYFQTNNAIVSTLDTSGNFLVGTTSALSVVATNTKGFQATPAGNVIQNFQTSPEGIALNYGAYTSGTVYPVVFRAAGSVVGYINYNGTLVNYVGTSDQRFKTNIVNSPDALPVLDSIKVRQFNWLSNNLLEQYGFIAQELNAVYPSAAFQGKDNEDGTVNVPWGVDPSKLVPLLVKSIQELNAKFDAYVASHP